MATPRRKPPPSCRQCGRERRLGYVISFRGLCRDCAVENMVAPGQQVAAGKGPYYEKWRDGMKRAADALE